MGLFRHDGPLSFNLFKENFWSGRIYVASAAGYALYFMRMACSRRPDCENIVFEITLRCFMYSVIENDKRSGTEQT